MLSIIIPVYNVEKYLDNCITSVLNQTLKDIEIILVDDGSTDSSGVLCDQWAKKDSRITVYHKPNGGLMSAWKYGVVRANGTYIGFVDSDDWIDCDMYERMVAAAIDTNVDLVCSAFVEEFPSGEKYHERINLPEGFYDRSRILAEIFPYLLSSREYRCRILSPNRVTKIFKTDLLLQVLEDCNEEVSLGEDLVTTFAYHQRAHSLYIMGAYHPYHYRANPDSMTKNFSDNNYQKIIILMRTLLEINEKYKTYDFEQQIYTDFVALYFNTVMSNISFSQNSRLAKHIRNIFWQEEIQQAISKCNISMLNRKTKLCLRIMQLNLVEIVILLQKTNHLFKKYFKK